MNQRITPLKTNNGFIGLILFLIFSLKTTPSVFGQARIISGPMLGYIEHREALVWIEVSKEVESVKLKYYIKGKPETTREAAIYPTGTEEYRTVKAILEYLDMNTEYEYSIYLNDELATPSVPTTFRTKKLWEWREAAPDFSFLLGSCFYINDTYYDRPGKPYGNDPSILTKMGDMPTDFMLWLGDNTYLREADYSSASGIAYRYSYNFRLPEMQKLRATRANYAIWDDHDFGPDNSNTYFELKDVALETFKSYWGNKTFGEAENGGVYHKFSWSDCDFFCLDGRYHRSSNELPDSIAQKPNPDKVFFGKRQLAWLKNNLINSPAPFKFIVNGGQVLNPAAGEDCFTHFKAEWWDLMNFIIDNKIKGVVFLTGDRHYSELSKWQPSGFYPLYDFTCSSVTAGISRPDKNNSLRVEGSVLAENNFGKISVSGKKGERQVRLETFDAKGSSRWSFTIHEKDLKVNR
jgi:alkaline phosphatase D